MTNRDHGTARTPGGFHRLSVHRFSVRAPMWLMALLTMAGMTSALVASPASAATTHAAAPRAISTTNLGYTSLSAPVRIADTRTGATDPSTYAGDTLAAGASLTVDMPSSVPSDAGAIVAQLTAIDSTEGGYLAAYPAGGTAPTTANVNFVAGQIVGNMVTVALGTDSANGDLAVSILNGAGTGAVTNFTLDLYGYYAPQTSSSGAAYVPITPTRIVDTRAGSGYAGAGQTLGAGDTLEVPVTGSNGVPANATAVAVNIAVVNTTAQSYIQSYPAGSPPSSSTPTVNENWLAGEVLSTKAIVGIGTGGAIDIFNDEGDTDVVIDLDGYFTAAGGTGALFNSLSAPVRLCDTRISTTGCAEGAVAPGASLTVPTAGASGIPSTATAGVLNVTDIASGPNYLTVYPTGQSVPTAADVNYTSGDTSDIVGNAAYAMTGTSGDVSIYNSTGQYSSPNPSDIVVDAFGYFAMVSAAATYTVSPSTATTTTVSTTAAATSGDETYTVSGLGTSSANIALFPCSGTDAPVTGSGGVTTFTSTGGSGSAGNAAGEGATQSNAGGALGGANPGYATGTVAAGTSTAYISSVNGVATTANGTANEPTIVYGVTPQSGGSLTFVLNSFLGDCAIPVVYTAPSTAGTDPALAVGTNAEAASGYEIGVGGSTTWSPAAAGSGTYDGYEVISVNSSADTFQASPTGSATGALTFTYGQTGSTYTYDETPGAGGATTALPISETTFAGDVSGIVTPTPATSTAPATLGAVGDSLDITYGGGSSPGTFAFNGVVPGTAGTKNGDVPAAPNGLTATYESAVTSGTGAHPAGVLLNWAAPGNPDVYQYQVQVATVNTTTGVIGAFADAGAGDTVSASGVYTANAPAGVVSGTESGADVTETAPLTNFFDPNEAGGTTVVYRVYAIADGNNSSSTSPSTPNSTQVAVSASATANVTGPLSNSTSYVPAAGTDTTLAKSDTIDVFFNTAVAAASTWTMDIVDKTGNEAQIGNTDATATSADGGLELAFTINETPTILVDAEPTFADAPFEILSATGIAGTGTGTPAWNIEASGSSSGTVIESGTTVDVTREIEGTAAGGTETNNTALQTASPAPTVTVFGSSSTTTPNSITSTCGVVGEYLNVYTSAGTYVTSIKCTAVGATNYPSTSFTAAGVTLTSGNTYIVAESPLEASSGYESAASPGPESASAVSLAQ